MIAPYKSTFRVSQAYWNLRADGTRHQGYDLVGIDDKEIYSTVYGKVIRAGWENAANHAQGWGQRVVVQIGSTKYFMYFGHLSSIAVVTGQLVTPGTLIGTEGSTGHSSGSHLHWEIRYGDKKTGVRSVAQYAGIPNTASKTSHSAEDGAAILGTGTLRMGQNDFPACLYNSILQERLTELRYADVGPADGLFGAATESAVRLFQKYMGLTVDGKVGPLTKAKLFT